MTITSLLSSITIIYLPIGSITNWYTCWDIGWVYPWGNTIVVCDIDKSKDFYKFHEVWHYFWRNKMTEKEQQEYSKLRAKTYWREWGKTSIEEDFADNFWLLYYRKEKYSWDVKIRVQFIKKLVLKK